MCLHVNLCVRCLFVLFDSCIMYLKIYQPWVGTWSFSSYLSLPKNSLFFSGLQWEQTGKQNVIFLVISIKHQGKKHIPGVTKECFLEALKYLKTSKQHPFETPGKVLFLSKKMKGPRLEAWGPLGWFLPPSPRSGLWLPGLGGSSLNQTGEVPKGLLFSIGRKRKSGLLEGKGNGSLGVLYGFCEI